MRTFEKTTLALCLFAILLSIYTLQTRSHIAAVVHHIVHPHSQPKPDPFIIKVTSTIVKRYSVDSDLAKAVAESASRHQYTTFPKAADIVAIVAIESSFNPLAKSKLKTDPALGLTQIRNVAWKKQIAGDDMTQIDAQIKHGAYILAHYYSVTQDKDKAIMAYNVGLKAVMKGRKSENYLKKYNREIIAFNG
jgi:hypothetical protein